jgi:hypothetical protein
MPRKSKESTEQPKEEQPKEEVLLSEVSEDPKRSQKKPVVKIIKTKDKPSIELEPNKAPKPKKKLSEKQLENLKKGAEALAKKREQRKKEKEDSSK